MRTDIVRLIHTEAPEKPACFETQGEWTQYLVSAHEAGQKVVRRVDTGKHAGKRETHFAVLPVGQQSHCAECSQKRRDVMKAAGRCFPVNPPKQQEPEGHPDQPAAGRRFDLSGIATIERLKAGKKGPEESRYLALDIDVEFQRVEASVCAFFDDMLAAFLYRQELAGRVVRNASLKPISYAQQVTGATVCIDRQTFHNSDISNFVITPIDGTAVALACRITLYPGKANCNDLLGRIKDGVRIRIQGPDDLFDQAEDHKPQRQGALI